MSDVLDVIADMVVEAKQRGIPARRLYLGRVKQDQLNDALSEMFGHGVDVVGGEYRGMKVVASKKPGIAIGQ